MFVAMLKTFVDYELRPREAPSGCAVRSGHAAAACGFDRREGSLGAMGLKPWRRGAESIEGGGGVRGLRVEQCQDHADHIFTSFHFGIRVDHIFTSFHFGIYANHSFTGFAFPAKLPYTSAPLDEDTPMQYVKKPVVIEAVQFKGRAATPHGETTDFRTLFNETPAWLGHAIQIRQIVFSLSDPDLTYTAHIKTLEGTMTASPGDWIILGVKSEIYPCKPDIFAATYAAPRTVDLDYSEALIYIKQGKRLARAGWNGKDMFVFLVPGSTFQVNRPPLLGIYPEGTTINYHAHIDMRTVDGQIVPWLASQTDLLAEDWYVVDSEPAPQ